ncbi:hemolysin family protein [Oleiagrimonas sp. C23AA]|uniref:hemolysin family protein n=1 Tax=Oleiagrimonas sp. C23AA TaxID=2719047 RepID=UPI001420F3FF|nr:hemolysin family protein [Oleiagrimonas sp. C23AA]NII11539.1 HlyC/CorC family transporter [Oleiagrimonas sp. C23AA]
MLTKLGLIVVLALINGFFALSEMAIIASRKSRLKQLARDRRGARVALRLAEWPDRFLSTVQVGITALMLITGAVTGASLGERFAALLESAGLPWLVQHAVLIGWLVGFFVATSIQIVLGELVPKRIALLAPERLASTIAMPMLVLAKLCSPFVWVLNLASSGVLRLLGLNKIRREAVTEEEIRLLVAEGAEQGVLDADEHNMVNRVLRLGDRSVDSLMTPRTRITWLDAGASREDNLHTLQSTPYSRYPVYRGNESEILGIVEVKRLFNALQRPGVPLFRVLAKPLFVPETARALDLLEAFRDAEAPLALVVDEYGDIQGLVTFNDVLAAVVGKTPSGDDNRPDAPVVRRPDGSWLIDGSVGAEDLRELLKLSSLPHEDEHDFHTAGGMMVAAFGRIPLAGETFAWQGYRFEVLDLDGARVDKLLITPPDDPAQPLPDAS